MWPHRGMQIRNIDVIDGKGGWGWIAGPKCGTKIRTGLLLGYEEGRKGVPIGQKSNPF